MVGRGWEERCEESGGGGRKREGRMSEPARVSDHNRIIF